MSHQSGIGGTEELTQAFAEVYNSETTRLIKVEIQDEKLVPTAVVSARGDWESDWDGAIRGNTEEKKPCYILYRLDERNSNGFNFVFIAWSPDFAHIRSKMLYASTRATLKSLFGSSYVSTELFGTVPADVSLAGYKKHLQAEEAPPPLSNAEIEKAEIRAAETGVEIGASTKRAMAAGVQFPLSSVAIEKLNQLKAGSVAYVQLKLDLSKETVELALADNTDAHNVAKKIPADSARYHVFSFKHNHEGDTLTSLVFVYSCPGYKIPVKERMLYSSCKGPLLDQLNQEFSIEFVKTLEIGDGNEFTYDWLYDQLHPAKTVFKAKFDRPKRPGKGGRRLMRGSAGEGDAGDAGEEGGDE